MVLSPECLSIIQNQPNQSLEVRGEISTRQQRTRQTMVSVRFDSILKMHPVRRTTSTSFLSISRSSRFCAIRGRRHHSSKACSTAYPLCKGVKAARVHYCARLHHLSMSVTSDATDSICSSSTSRPSPLNLDQSSSPTVGV